MNLNIVKIEKPHKNLILVHIERKLSSEVQWSKLTLCCFHLNLNWNQKIRKVILQYVSSNQQRNHIFRARKFLVSPTEGIFSADRYFFVRMHHSWPAGNVFLNFSQHIQWQPSYFRQRGKVGYTKIDYTLKRLNFCVITPLQIQKTVNPLESIAISLVYSFSCQSAGIDILSRCYTHTRSTSPSYQSYCKYLQLAAFGITTLCGLGKTGGGAGGGGTAAVHGGDILLCDWNFPVGCSVCTVVLILLTAA